MVVIKVQLEIFFRCFVPGYDNDDTTYDTPFNDSVSSYLFPPPETDTDSQVYCYYCNPSNIGGANCTTEKATKCPSFIYDTSQYQSSIVSLVIWNITILRNIKKSVVWFTVQYGLRRRVDEWTSTVNVHGRSIFWSRNFWYSWRQVHTNFLAPLRSMQARFSCRIGRRKTFLIGGLLSIVSANVVPFATNYYAYCALQVVIGAVQVGTYLTAFIVGKYFSDHCGVSNLFAYFECLQVPLQFTTVYLTYWLK